MKPDIIDDLSHGIVHDLARLKLKSLNEAKIHKHIDSILRKYVELARTCPYAGMDGAPCKLVKEIIDELDETKLRSSTS